jgi:maltooligosyltrehalose trehalohydrolase
LGAAVTMLSPFVPMIFQGEEWSASTPFQYFVGFEDPRLGEAIRKGRIDEFGALGWNPDNLPDPQSENTWRCSQLRREECADAPHAEILSWYKELIALRRSQPDFKAGPFDESGVKASPEAGWLFFTRGRYIVICNFSDRLQEIDCGARAEIQLTLASDAGIQITPHGLVKMPAWCVAVVLAQ